MYADRYTSRQGLNPGGVLFSLGVSGVLLFGLSLSAPNFVRSVTKHFVAKSYQLPDDPPPIKPVEPKRPSVRTPVATPKPAPVDLTKPLVKPTTGSDTGFHFDLDFPLIGAGGTGTDIGTNPPPPLPVIINPRLDGRYRDLFQPSYPSDERLAGNSGRVVVRVLIGTDGRVKDVQLVSAASTAFFEATRKQALSKWRFTPGTRDGTPVEAWLTMTVRFVLDAE